MESITAEEIKNLITNVGKIKDTVEKTDKKIDKITTEINTLKEENKNMKKEIKTLNSEIEILNRRMNNLDQYSRKNNMIISNIPQQTNEVIYEVVTKFLTELGVKIGYNDFGAVHRLGAPEGKTSPIIVRLLNNDKKSEIIKKSKLHKPHGRNFGFNPAVPIFISEQLTRNSS